MSERQQQRAKILHTLKTGGHGPPHPLDPPLGVDVHSDTGVDVHTFGTYKLQ